MGSSTRERSLNLFVFGLGFSGNEIARLSKSRGISVSGTTRSQDKASRLKAAGVDAHVFSSARDIDAIASPLATCTHMIVCAGPDEDGDPVLNALGNRLPMLMPKLEWIGYLSTVGVYGDHDGAWVDEETQCRPVSPRSVERLRAEADWQAAANSAGVPLAILRLSGIYGPGRNTFVNLADGSAKRVIKPGQYFNRIHVADIAGAALFLGEKRAPGLFNVTDDVPAPPQDVVTYAAELMGLAPPPEIAFDDAQLSPMARSFYGEVKRVSNLKVRQAGYEFQFPDYRAALNAMWQNQNWRG
jgi:nucleoside-diphosphate-sugar epimerase